MEVMQDDVDIFLQSRGPKVLPANTSLCANRIGLINLMSPDRNGSPKVDKFPE